MYEYKIVCTGATGVPSDPECKSDVRSEQLEAGLNLLAREGWVLATMNGSSMMIFVRELNRDEEIQRLADERFEQMRREQACERRRQRQGD